MSLVKGLLISLEGSDGSGKTSLVNMLHENLVKDYPDLVFNKFREPGDTLIAEKIRSILLDKDSVIAPKAELMLFQAARAQLLYEKIIPALKRKEIVLLDRFIDSTRAYQGVARGHGLRTCKMLENIVVGEYIPDTTFYLDVEPEVGLNRSKKRLSLENSNESRFENLDLDFYNKVRKGFIISSKLDPGRIITLDSNRLNICELYNQAKEYLDDLIEIWSDDNEEETY